MVVVVAALFAFYAPTSMSGVISRTLTAVSLLTTCGLLGALLLARGGVVPLPMVLATSLGILTLLIAFTLFSPFDAYSPGVVFIYVAMALLYVTNLRTIEASAFVEYVAIAMSIATLAIGAAIVARLSPVTAILKSYYAAFYPELVPNMIDMFHKPVTTFATHSIAGFMIYLLFFMAFKGFQLRGRALFLALALGHLTLLALLRSTTGTIYAIIGFVQLGWLLAHRFPRSTAFAGIGVIVGLIAVLPYFDIRPGDLLNRAETAVVGNKIVGLVARYAPQGLLAGNVVYMSKHPLSPIGFSFSNSLYLGDSGVVVHALRGSIPLLLAVYGGLFLSLRYNILSPSAATWLWCVVVLFEVGFTPLMYFRFVGFAPLLVVYLNGLESQQEIGEDADSPARS
jgi:hypothetical protein